MFINIQGIKSIVNVVIADSQPSHQIDSFTFCPWLAWFLDRLKAILNNQVPPDWARRFAEVKDLYPS